MIIKDDFINDNNIVPILEDYKEFLTDVVDKRFSCDKQINKFGKDLLNPCKTYSLLICNGITGEDKGIGNFTFAGPRGNSVIELIICSNSVFDLIESLKVEERTESSHFPVSLSLPCTNYTIVLKDHTTVDETHKNVYNFNQVNTTQYRINLTAMLSI